MIFKVEIEVMPHPELLDPQGKAISGVLSSMDYNQVESVRMGRRIEMTVKAGTKAEAEKIATDIATNVLINPIIEHFVLKVSKN